MLLLLFAAFIRCPSILIHGRMWAEELPVFLRFSQRHSFTAALPVQHFGYFSLWDNFFGALAAHCEPIGLVALLFSWSAVIVLLLTGYFIFEAEFWRLAQRSCSVLWPSS
jgi:hypothetical protein